MKFENWETPIQAGSVSIVDISYGTKDWFLELANGVRYSIAGSDRHEERDLLVRVFHEETESLYEVCYECVCAFRCLDEHELLEVWGDPGRPPSNTFKLKEHLWHKESPISFLSGNTGEFSHMIATDWECLEVICKDTPTFKFLEKVQPTKPA